MPLTGWLIEIFPTRDDDEVFLYESGYNNSILYHLFRSVVDHDSDLAGVAAIAYYPMYTSKLTDLICTDGNYPYLEHLLFFSHRKPDFLLFPCYIWSIRHVIDLARYLKAILPDTLMICGGPSVSSVERAERFLTDHEWFDIVIRGYGELPLREVLRWRLGLRDLRSIPQVSSRRECHVEHNDECFPITALDDLPSIILEGYYAPRSEFAAMHLQNSRGCRMKCRFCYFGGASREAGRLILRSVEQALEEVRYILVNYPRTWEIVYWDNYLFGGDTRLIERFLEGVITIRKELDLYRIPMYGYLDYRTTTAATLRLCARALFMQVNVGLQSYDPASWTDMGRPKRLRHATVEFVRLLKAHDMPTMVDTIIGLPSESKRDFLDSLQGIIRDLEPDVINTNIFRLLPDTNYALERERYGIEEVNGNVMGTARMEFTDIMAAQKIMWGLRIGYEPHRNSFLILCKVLGISIIEVFEIISDWLCDTTGLHGGLVPEDFTNAEGALSRFTKQYSTFLEYCTERFGLPGTVTRTLREIARFDLLSLKCRFPAPPPFDSALVEYGLFESLSARHNGSGVSRQAADDPLQVSDQFRLFESGLPVDELIAACRALDDPAEIRTILAAPPADETRFLFHGFTATRLNDRQWRFLEELKDRDDWSVAAAQEAWGNGEADFKTFMSCLEQAGIVRIGVRERGWKATGDTVPPCDRDALRGWSGKGRRKG
ncbi:radical SAM protein [bacterium]|nr:radical SAM protein [candidate division CSSED10-310 bacterium]